MGKRLTTLANIAILMTMFGLASAVLGQTSTDASRKPNIFLPELTSKIPDVRDMTISRNGLEAFFTVESQKRNISLIVRIEKGPEEWSEPEVASFSGQFRDIEPHLSQDGLRLYFASNRPLDPGSEIKDYDLWVVARAASGQTWSVPQNLGPVVNSTGNEYYPTVSSSGNLYFTAELPDSKGKEDIYVSLYDGQKYLSPVSLSDSINSEFYEFNAFIHPSESYIIFTSYGREGGQGGIRRARPRGHRGRDDRRLHRQRHHPGLRRGVPREARRIRRGRSDHPDPLPTRGRARRGGGRLRSPGSLRKLTPKPQTEPRSL